MTFFGQISAGAGEPEKLVALLATLGLLAVAAWRAVRWFLEVKPSPDPWDEAITVEIAKDDAVPLCPHCLAQHSGGADFCPDCGAPVGQYTNWLPFPQLFSVGHVLRLGTSGKFKRTPLMVFGFMLFSLIEYALFVPIYWIIFLCKLINRPPDEAPPEQPPPSPAPTNQ